MRLSPGARVAVIGAGPGGLAAAKHARDAGFDVTILEAGDRLGGQWDTAAAHSGIWPGMRTNTSRAMTAFSDLPAPSDHPLHPTAVQILAYLEDYAARFGLREHIAFGRRVEHVAPGWTVDGEPFDGVVVASGRFRRPRLAPGLEAFTGELLHAFDYPGAEPFRDRRTLVYGNGVSGLEVAADLATATEVVASFRKPRYVISKVAAGVSSDWQWYTMFGGLLRRSLPPAAFGAWLRERVVATAGHPADFGAPAPDPDILVAGTSLCQDWLPRVSSGAIRCRPAIAAIEGRTVTFTDGSRETVDAIVSATGYDLDLPYLDAEVRRLLGPGLDLVDRTLHPDLPGLGFVGQYLLQGPYWPLLELQARWIVGTWSGTAPAAEPQAMRAALAAPRPAMDAHNVLALALGAQAGVAPDLGARPELAEGLVFGPMLPSRWRLDGPGARPDAPERFAAELASSPRAPVPPEDVEALAALGLADAAAALAAR